MKTKPKVFVDFREWKIIGIVANFDFPLEKRQNQWGDFEVVNDQGKIICIAERKTISDAFNSLRSGHWDDQMERASHYCRLKQIPYFLVINGNLEKFIEKERRRRRYKLVTNGYAFKMGIASAAVRYGAHIIWIENKEEMLETVFGIFQKIYEGKLFKQKRIIIRDNKGYPQNVVRLHRLCGISLNLSHKLIKKFGSIRGVLFATDKELLGIKGFGEKTLLRLREVLG